MKALLGSNFVALTARGWTPPNYNVTTGATELMAVVGGASPIAGLFGRATPAITKSAAVSTSVATGSPAATGIVVVVVVAATTTTSATATVSTEAARRAATHFGIRPHGFAVGRTAAHIGICPHGRAIRLAAAHVCVGAHILTCKLTCRNRLEGESDPECGEVP